MRPGTSLPLVGGAVVLGASFLPVFSGPALVDPDSVAIDLSMRVVVGPGCTAWSRCPGDPIGLDDSAAVPWIC